MGDIEVSGPPVDRAELILTDEALDFAATAEISRSQVWQWLFNEATLDTGDPVTRGLVERLVEEEYAALGTELGDVDHLEEARDLFVGSALSEEYPDFLTLPAYRSVLAAERRSPGHRRSTPRPGQRCWPA